MTRPTLAPGAVAAAAVVAIAAAWLAFAGLSGLAKPQDLKARLVALDAAAGRIEQAPHAGGDPSSYPRHALCRGQPPAEAQALQARLSAAATASGMTGPKIAVTPPDVTWMGARPTPVLFQLEATGRYDAALSLLKLLADGEPELFADQLDIKSQTSTVWIKLTGRVLCSTSAA